MDLIAVMIMAIHSTAMLTTVIDITVITATAGILAAASLLGSTNALQLERKLKILPCLPAWLHI